MRILLLTETLAAGGAEKFIVRLANGLSHRHDVCVAVMHGELVNPAVAAQLHADVRLETLSLPLKRQLWRADTALRKATLDLSLIRGAQRRWLKALIERFKPDVVHSHLLKADILAADVLAKDGQHAAHVVTMHGDYAPYLKGEADPLIRRLPERTGAVLSRASAIVGVCAEHIEFLTERYGGSVAGKLALIYNGYAPGPAEALQKSRAELGLPEDKFLFGMAGRGVEKKGWGQALRAFENLARRDCALVLVGEGPYLDALHRTTTRNDVIFAGFSAEPVAYIRHFDVALMPTLFPHESLPTVIMEYLYCGKPIVATDVGEIARMMTHGDDLAGALLSFRDGTIAADELSAAMADLLDSPDKRRAAGSVAIEAFAKFDMEQCVASYEHLYDRFIRHAA